ncbi:pitrilysin family protein [Bacteroides sp. 224]|uniref:M16 family metallopeptidase n=1 Tax=Bacteroides sp. 224 TaxID=2302936 RepID=UPI0013D7177B|nr:pitrilysin family protein [Bacteroides sp. 224]NDV66892.1 insulinase family protein [Bacteroides sp. 224]
MTLLNRTIQPEIRELDQIGILYPEKTILPNGIPLYMIRAGEQEIVRLDLVFKGGSWHQTQKLQALFTNRMLREGTLTYSSAEISEKLDYYGAWLELSSSMEYAFITLYSLNKYFAETLEILNSIVKEPIFPEREFQQVIETNIQQYKVNTQKVDFIAHRSLLKNLFGTKHPCGNLAEEKDYDLVTPDLLREFYEIYYTQSNCSVYISGKVTDDIVNRIERVLGTDFFGKGTEIPVQSDKVITISEQKRIFTECPNAMQSAIKLGYHSITRLHPDYPKLRVLVTLFGGYFGSRLMSNIREDKGYTYGIGAGMMFYPGTGLLAISSETDNEYVEPLIKEVYHEIDKLHLETVSQEELSTVKNYMLGEMCRSYESAFSLSDAWIFVHTSGLPEDTFERSLQAVRETDAAELKRLANLYLCKESLKEVIAGKKIV